MIFRMLNLVVIGALILAAAWVYRIKFDATVQAEHLAKLRGEVRAERDKIAALRAEWGELDDPARIQALADRFLHLKPIAPTQFDPLDRLPDRPSANTAADADPIGSLIENFAEPHTTGAIGKGIAAAPSPVDSSSQTRPAASSPDGAQPQ